MNKQIQPFQSERQDDYRHKSLESIPLYPGIEWRVLTLSSTPLSIQRKRMEQVIQINYCTEGQLLWEIEDNPCLRLNPGDLSIHSMKFCTNSVISAPTGHYRGIVLCIDLSITAAAPPEVLKGTDIFTQILPNKYGQKDTVTLLPRSEETEHIFSAFNNQPDALRLPIHKMKALELILYLCGLELHSADSLAACKPEQIAMVKEIHDQLLQNMEQRITIEALSKKYLVNTTTLKTAFKAVYGTSIAAHIKEHRMECAAKMLRESDLSIAEIAQAIGYDSQSKFAATFKCHYNMLPRDYRRKPAVHFQDEKPS